MYVIVRLILYKNLLFLSPSNPKWWAIFLKDEPEKSIQMLCHLKKDNKGSNSQSQSSCRS